MWESRSRAQEQAFPPLGKRGIVEWLSSSGDKEAGWFTLRSGVPAYQHSLTLADMSNEELRKVSTGQ